MLPNRYTKANILRKLIISFNKCEKLLPTPPCYAALWSQLAPIIG